MHGNRLCRIVCGALLVVPAAAQMAGMNHQNRFVRKLRYLLIESLGIFDREIDIPNRELARRRWQTHANAI